MAKPFKILQAKMRPEARARSQALAKGMMATMALQELRRARRTTQTKLARALKVNQAAVSKLERRTDMYISTLRSYVEAMGGQLDVIARFNEGSVKIAQFKDLGSPARMSRMI
jgi:DNA-binding XRE family transcriptional regulator